MLAVAVVGEGSMAIPPRGVEDAFDFDVARVHEGCEVFS